MRIVLVVKGLGIGFFEAAAEGGEEAAKEIGGVEVIYTGPATTTAEAQIEVINSLIAQKVDAIAISATIGMRLLQSVKKLWIEELQLSLGTLVSLKREEL